MERPTRVNLRLIPGVLLTAVIALLACAAGYAATEPAGKAAGATAGSTRILEEVIVKATKRDSSLQDTGIAITVLSAEELRFRDINNIEDLESSVPGLKVGTVLGTPLINIRGVGLNFLSGLGNPGVATHYDGIYLTRTGSVNVATTDVQHVEVLRGPQGTLYGRNATGGSVNFLSKRPGNQFGANLIVGGGDYGREIYEFSAEGPLVNDDFALRLFLRQDQFDGYGRDETSDRTLGDNRATSAHLAARYALNDSLDIYASYTWREDEGSTNYSTAETSVTGLFHEAPYPTHLQSFETFNIRTHRRPETDKESEVYNLTVQWDAGDYVLRSLTGYTTHERAEYGHAPEIEIFVVDVYRTEDSEAWSQEFNLSSDTWFGGRLNWLLGVYYQEDEAATPYGSYINLEEFNPSLPSFAGHEFVYAPTSETFDVSKAVFIDGFYSLREDLRLVFGVRYSDDRREFTQTFLPFVQSYDGVRNEDLTRTLMLLAGGTIETCENEHNRLTFSSTDPKLGVEWDVNENNMAYVQYQTGFKSGGFDTSTGCNETYDPEEIEAYEIGVKSVLLDGALTINAAAFDYDYTDYQVERVEGFQSVIDNAAAASARGLELEGSYAPIDWLRIDAQYAYLDATYDEYFARDNFLNTTPISNDAPVEDLSGNTLSRSPEHTLNIGLSFYSDLSSLEVFGLALGEKLHLGEGRFRVESYYSDEVHFREFNRPEERQNSYTTYNAFLSITSRSGLVTLSLFGKNLSDEEYGVGQIPFDSVLYRGYYYAPPKTVGATLSINL